MKHKHKHPKTIDYKPTCTARERSASVWMSSGTSPSHRSSAASCKWPDKG